MDLCLIHTGGTIGMARTPRGYAPKAGLVEAEVARLIARHELRAEVEIARLDPLIDSANATPADWTRIAEAIAARHDAAKGFVVTHGTDTLAHTAAALAFALEGLARPVIVTGAMRPLGETGSDGPRNLSDALDTALLAPPGVWVQFAGRRLHGARVRKSHSSADDAFTAADEARPPRVSGPKLTLHPYRAPEIGILTMAPGVSGRLVAAALELCDGLVLRCYGSGTVPDLPQLRDGLMAARAAGKPVIAVSQAPQGRLALGTYAAGALLVEAGVADGADMSVEAAYAKLAHVLSRDLGPEDRHAMLARPLCGEASL
ncbi:asparaginase [Wenxinia marina]|uniref:Asparaginase n=1 Tax=Wenxinia marina DSM 24838 TaxID=1123501 RepID=A0A0D0QES1_9RHOB|nr:asparaginase [Wenxinia marina]KIQ70832.1 asparaginase [Wenxinia marina DSM 24838]GGL56954.1 L-asparaginase 1 [Wenxinia marina]